MSVTGRFFQSWKKQEELEKHGRGGKKWIFERVPTISEIFVSFSPHIRKT